MSQEKFIQAIKNPLNSQTIEKLQKAKIWICGIEPGSYETAESIKSWLNGEYRNDPPVFSPEFKKIFEKEWRSWRYHQNSAKILHSYLCAGKEQRKNHWDYFENDLYNDDIAFPINLFPLCFKNINTTTEEWGKVKKLTTVATKNDYYQQCRDHAFPALNAIYNEIKPPLVICTGLGAENDFIQVFNSSDNQKIEKHSDFFDYKPRIEVYKNSIGHVVITPHLSGAIGWSDEKRRGLGKLLATLSKPA